MTLTITCSCKTFRYSWDLSISGLLAVVSVTNRQMCGHINLCPKNSHRESRIGNDDDIRAGNGAGLIWVRVSSLFLFYFVSQLRVTGLLWTKLSNKHILSCSASLLLQGGGRRWRKKQEARSKDWMLSENNHINIFTITNLCLFGRLVPRMDIFQCAMTHPLYRQCC